MDLPASQSSAFVFSSDFTQSLPLKGSYSSSLRKSFRLKDCAIPPCSEFSNQLKQITTTHRLGSSFGSAPFQRFEWSDRHIHTLLIDNYDSYTYNLYQLLCVINRAPPRVIKNDELPWEDLYRLLCEERVFDSIVISPGPGSPMCPKDIGVCLQVLQECADIPILGVCLGHQALGYVNGARVVHAPEPVHGRLSEIKHIHCPLFKGVPSGKASGFEVVRYHSLMLEKTSMPEDLIQTAWTVTGFETSSAKDPLVNSLEHEKALIDGTFKAITCGFNGTGFLDERDWRYAAMRKDSWAYKPSRLLTTGERIAVPNNGSAVYTNLDALLAEDKNTADGLSSISRCLSSEGENKTELVMAIAHRKRPHYGVQFHPESVATSFGRKILENFRDITLEYWKNIKPKDFAQRGISSQSASEDSKVSERSRSCPLRIYWEKVDGIAASAGGSEGIFCCLFGAGTAQDTFWLDSALQPGGGRFSFLGGKGGRLWKRLTYSLSGKHGSGGILSIENDENITKLPLEKGFLKFLASELQSFTTSKEDSEGLPFDFWGGYVGYLGYELKLECGARFNRHKSKLPDACFFFVDRFIAVDHLTNDVYAVVLYTETPCRGTEIETSGVTCSNVSDNTQRMPDLSGCEMLPCVFTSTNSAIHCPQKMSAEAWVKEMLQKIQGLAADGRDVATERRYSVQLAPSSSSKIHTATPFVIGKSRNQYMEDVKSCLKYIRDGESYELCLTTRLWRRVASLDALGLYLTLRKMNPAPYAAWLNFGLEEACVCCSSPERFLRLDQNGMIEAKPIKGTIPRGQSVAEDEALRMKLQYSEKDRAENLMIVDLLRNDLGRVCEPGSVHVPSLMAVESYATVHTMVSTVRGMKRSDMTALDCVRASFPGGSMTGAPKLRSMELLDYLECGPRGVYSGSIGFFSVNSTFDLNIVIRTLVIHQDVVSLGAGGAVVALSDPADEYEEMLLKTRAPVSAVLEHEQAFPNLSNQSVESGESLSYALSGSH